ncbi:MAG: hypothetical protein BWK76_14415 [Desulfobulbaceae bacterium A2]|nr:MAG: hypothetical protein BWK76_14415 [Desulfobulbaceae bacterium A2]
MQKRLFATLVGAAMVLPVAAWADSISPSSFSATLSVGESVTVHKTVTIDREATTSMGDVFFLADTTSSMNSPIGNVITNASTILSNLAGKGDIQYAVGDYRDFVNDPYAYNLGQSMTNSQAEAQTAINKWSASGGGDWPEAELYALSQLATNPGSGWRAGAARFVVWFGDAPGHDPSGGATLASTIADLNAMNIHVLAIDVGKMDYYGQALAIATGTGGAYYSGSADVSGTILAALATAFDTYSDLSIDTGDAPAGVGVAVAPGSYSGAFDRSIERTFDFDVTFTGVTPGDYTFDIYGTLDYGRVAIERDHITVTGATVPEPGTMILLGSGLLGLSGFARLKHAA